MPKHPITYYVRSGRESTHTRQLRAANGAATANLAYDGVPFFSANHASGVAGVQSNILTPSAVDPAAPTVAEFKTAMKQAIAKVVNLLDDQGEPMNNDATGWCHAFDTNNDDQIDLTDFASFQSALPTP